MSYLNHKAELGFAVIAFLVLGMVIGAVATVGVVREMTRREDQVLVEAIEQQIAKPPRQAVTCVISGPHPGVDSPDFPMKVIDGKIHVKHAETGEWVTGPVDGNEDVYIDAYHADNPHRRKRFVFVDGEWAETIYDVKETE